MAEKRTADDLPAQREQPFYSRAVRERIAELIQCKQDADKEQFFADLEALAYGLTVAGKRKIIDPRLTRDRLDKVIAAIHRLEKEFNALEKLEAKTRHVKSIASAWGEPTGDGKTPLDWDDVEDAREVLKAFATTAEQEVRRFREHLGTSPAKIHPVLGWASSVWFLYRKVDRKPAIGKRAAKAGRSQELLDILGD